MCSRVSLEFLFIHVELHVSLSLISLLIQFSDKAPVNRVRRTLYITSICVSFYCICVCVCVYLLHDIRYCPVATVLLLLATGGHWRQKHSLAHSSVCKTTTYKQRHGDTHENTLWWNSGVGECTMEDRDHTCSHPNHTLRQVISLINCLLRVAVCSSVQLPGVAFGWNENLHTFSIQTCLWWGGDWSLGAWRVKLQFLFVCSYPLDVCFFVHKFFLVEKN